MRLCACMCLCARARVCACVCARVRACVGVCMRVGVHACACVYVHASVYECVRQQRRFFPPAVNSCMFITDKILGPIKPQEKSQFAQLLRNTAMKSRYLKTISPLTISLRTRTTPPRVPLMRTDGE